jgi:hypothetical protein
MLRGRKKRREVGSWRRRWKELLLSHQQRSYSSHAFIGLASRFGFSKRERDHPSRNRYQTLLRHIACPGFDYFEPGATSPEGRQEPGPNASC